ncbi:hypothetical protein C5167_017673 [Papaver somniferum]|uniref:Uncharacterized protein n=1 Tax=Papaver somniferum TaxID=3469 RepID=A0A4Y7IP51_PAPSO|nr:stress enhanced protein 2, chloroplastic-like [Papaver somniferum]RZC49235.1 hypothetical protein C5167_017673 [Papaver somniferum]
MATTVTCRAIFCELKPEKLAIQKLKSANLSSNDDVKVLLQPRVCTLRSYGSERAGLVRTATQPRRVVVDNGDYAEIDEYDGGSPFFPSLSEYIESSRKSRDIEMIFGRVSMVVFATTLAVESITGNSLFQKMDLQEITETAGACLAAVVFSAAFAYLSSARTKVNRVFNVKCNSFIDLFIDNLIEGLFFESELSDWVDDL